MVDCKHLNILGKWEPDGAGAAAGGYGAVAGEFVYRCVACGGRWHGGTYTLGGHDPQLVPAPSQEPSPVDAWTKHRDRMGWSDGTHLCEQGAGLAGYAAAKAEQAPAQAEPDSEHLETGARLLLERFDYVKTPTLGPSFSSRLRAWLQAERARRAQLPQAEPDGQPTNADDA